MYAKGTFSKLRLNFHITLRPGKKKKCLNHFQKRCTLIDEKTWTSQNLDRAKFHFRIADQKRSASHPPPPAQQKMLEKNFLAYFHALHLHRLIIC